MTVYMLSDTQGSRTKRSDMMFITEFMHRIELRKYKTETASGGMKTEPFQMLMVKKVDRMVLHLAWNQSSQILDSKTDGKEQK